MMPYKAIAAVAVYGLALLLARDQSPKGDSGTGIQRTLSFQVESNSLAGLPDVNFSAVKIAPSGALLFKTPDRWGIHQVSGTSDVVNSFSLHEVPEAARANLQMKRDFTIDSKGNFIIPANWFEWKRGSQLKAGVFIFDANGRYTSTVQFAMQCSPEGIEVDSKGNFLVLGVEGAYLRGTKKDCYLLHRFTSTGEHVGSFSRCPAVRLSEQHVPGHPSSAGEALRMEAEDGRLWIHNGLTYHMLPLSRLVRIFDADGGLHREVTLTPPESASLLATGGMTADPSRVQVRRIIPMIDGSYLVEWLHSEQVSSSGMRRTTFLAVHSQDGYPLSTATHPPARPSIPILCDNDGRILFLHLNQASGGRLELLRTSLIWQQPTITGAYR